MIISKPSLDEFFDIWSKSKNDIDEFSKLVCPFSTDLIIYKLIDSNYISLNDAVEYLFNTWDFKPGNRFRVFDFNSLTKYRVLILKCLRLEHFLLFFEYVIKTVRNDFLFEQKKYHTPVNFLRNQTNSTIELLGCELLSGIRMLIRNNSHLMASVTPLEGIVYNIDVLFELRPLFFEKDELCNYGRKLCELAPDLCRRIEKLRLLDQSAKTYGDLIFPSYNDSDCVDTSIEYC